MTSTTGAIQLDLFAPEPVEVKKDDIPADLTCPLCGQTARNEPLYRTNHSSRPGLPCISQILRRNHVTSYARALAARGAWPGRGKPPKDWTVEKAWADLDAAVDRAREVNIAADLIDAAITREGVTRCP